MARLWDRACPAESTSPFTRRQRCPRCLAQVGWGRWVVWRPEEARLRRLPFLPFPRFRWFKGVSEGSGSGVRSAGAIAGSGVGSGCTGCSLVAVVCGSSWGSASTVVGKGVAASVASVMGMDPESEASVGAGLLTRGAAKTRFASARVIGCRLDIHSL